MQGVYASCASIPSREFRQGLASPIPFQELLEGDAHRNERVVLGGYILETVNEPDGTRLTLLQAPLDSRHKPKSQDLSQGRFVVETREFLDPAIYAKDRKVTVGGKVWGGRHNHWEIAHTSIRSSRQRNFIFGPKKPCTPGLTTRTTIIGITPGTVIRMAPTRGIHGNI